MFCDQVVYKLSQGFPPLLFRKHAGNVARDRIRAPCPHLTVDSLKLFVWEGNSNF